MAQQLLSKESATLPSAEPLEYITHTRPTPEINLENSNL